MQSFSDPFQVDFDCYQVEPQGRIAQQVEFCNVVAVLPGRSDRRGFVGVPFTESRENYSRQHEPEDTLVDVDFEYLAKNPRVNAASVATITPCPSPGSQRDGRRQSAPWARRAGVRGFDELGGLPEGDLLPGGLARSLDRRVTIWD